MTVSPTARWARSTATAAAAIGTTGRPSSVAVARSRAQPVASSASRSPTTPATAASTVTATDPALLSRRAATLTGP